MSLEIRLHQDAEAVATSSAEALVEHLAALLSKQEVAHIVVTGGTVGILTLAKISQCDSSAVDWNRVHVWWGDERFVDHLSPDRNAVQAREAWLDASGVPEANIHEFPASDQGLSVNEAALAFDNTLARFASDAGAHPDFDLLLLGMGPDGHVASLFPGKPEIAPGVLTVAEHNSPKPPLLRLSMSFELINSAREVWLTIAGVDKADAVSVAFSENKKSLPVGNIGGLSKTVWFIDQAAASAI